VDKFPTPIKFEMPSFGKIIKSGLTDSKMRVKEDAFTPTRNLLFLVLAGAVASSRGMNNLVIGLLAERTTIFPDLSDRFLLAAETALTESIGIKMEIHSPLRDFTKQDVLNLAKKRGISDYYSCHSGAAKPCGKCIACLEYK